MKVTLVSHMRVGQRHGCVANVTSYIPGAYLSSGRGIILSRHFLRVLSPEMGDVRSTMPRTDAYQFLDIFLVFLTFLCICIIIRHSLIGEAHEHTLLYSCVHSHTCIMPLTISLLPHILNIVHHLTPIFHWCCTKTEQKVQLRN